jgi:hypothetical protein
LPCCLTLVDCHELISHALLALRLPRVLCARFFRLLVLFDEPDDTLRTRSWMSSFWFVSGSRERNFVVEAAT